MSAPLVLSTLREPTKLPASTSGAAQGTIQDLITRHVQDCQKTNQPPRQLTLQILHHIQDRPGSGFDLLGPRLLHEYWSSVPELALGMLYYHIPICYRTSTRNSKVGRGLEEAIDYALNIVPPHLRPYTVPDYEEANIRDMCMFLASLIPDTWFNFHDWNILNHLMKGATAFFMSHGGPYFHPGSSSTYPTALTALGYYAAADATFKTGSPVALSYDEESRAMANDTMTHRTPHGTRNKGSKERFKAIEENDAAKVPAATMQEPPSTPRAKKSKAGKTGAVEDSASTPRSKEVDSPKAGKKKRKRKSDRHEADSDEATKKVKFTIKPKKHKATRRSTLFASSLSTGSALAPANKPTMPVPAKTTAAAARPPVAIDRRPAACFGVVEDSSSSSEDEALSLAHRPAFQKATEPPKQSNPAPAKPVKPEKGLPAVAAKKVPVIIEIPDDEPEPNIKKEVVVEDPAPLGPEPKDIPKTGLVYMFDVQKTMLQSKNEDIRLLKNILEALKFSEDDIDVIKFRMATKTESLANAMRAVKEEKAGKKNDKKNSIAKRSST